MNSTNNRYIIQLFFISIISTWIILMRYMSIEFLKGKISRNSIDSLEGLLF